VTEQNARLSKDNGMLRAAVNQLSMQLKVVPSLLGELRQLRQALLTAQQQYDQVPAYTLVITHTHSRLTALCPELSG